MADMLTANPRKPMGAEAPARPERGRNSRTMAPSPIQSTGPLLRERREAMGVTLAEAEVATRIRQKYLAALEADEWDLLPGEVVGRGFLRNYATYLGLEPTEMIERRRAVADDALAAVLVNTSAGTALPPERKVDYRPKDVALKDETNELEAPRQLNLRPFLALLAVLALVSVGWWAVTQFGATFGTMMANAQRQVAEVQASLTNPAAPAVEAATPPAVVALPENLVAPTATAGAPVAPAVPAGEAAVATPVAAGAGAAAEAPPAPVEAAPPVVAEDVAPTPAPVVTEEAISLLGVLPTPTPVAEVAAPAPAAEVAPAAAASAAAASNLRGGPSTDFPVVGGATEGQALTIVGRNGDSTWYQLDSGGWIFAQLVTNPPAEVPVVETPPAPAPVAPAAEAPATEPAATEPAAEAPPAQP